MCAVMRKKANNSDEAQKNYPDTISSCDGNDAQIRKCFAAGFFLHAATLVTSGGNARASYQLLMQQQVRTSRGRTCIVVIIILIVIVDCVHSSDINIGGHEA